MDLVNSQHSDAVAIFGETSPVVLANDHRRVAQSNVSRVPASRVERRPNVRGILPPLGQIDADAQLRAPRSGFCGPIARPMVSVLLISVLMSNTNALQEQLEPVSMGLSRKIREHANGIPKASLGQSVWRTRGSWIGKNFSRNTINNNDNENDTQRSPTSVDGGLTLQERVEGS